MYDKKYMTCMWHRARFNIILPLRMNSVVTRVCFVCVCIFHPLLFFSDEVA